MRISLIKSVCLFFLFACSGERDETSVNENKTPEINHTTTEELEDEKLIVKNEDPVVVNGIVVFPEKFAGMHYQNGVLTEAGLGDNLVDSTGNDVNSEIVGTWDLKVTGNQDRARLQFKENGNFSMSSPDGKYPTYNGTYSIDGNQLNAGGIRYTFSIDGNNLYLVGVSSSATQHYTRLN